MCSHRVLFQLAAILQQTLDDTTRSLTLLPYIRYLRFRWPGLLRRLDCSRLRIFQGLAIFGSPEKLDVYQVTKHDSAHLTEHTTIFRNSPASQ